jgi:hypothetical protein
MKFLVLLFLIYHKKIMRNDTKLFSYNSKNSNTLKSKGISEKYNGYDHRFLNETLKTDEKEATLYKIQKHFEKKKLLNILQDANVSLATKLLLLHYWSCSWTTS